MILDGLLQFSSGQAITTTAPSTNVIDLSAARDLGIGDNPALKIFAAVAAAFTGGTSVNVQVQGSTDNSTFYTMAESGAILTAALTAGQRLLDIDLPRPQTPGQAIPRYLRLNYVVVGTFGAGTVNAYIVLDRQDQVQYPPGLVINN